MIITVRLFIKRFNIVRSTGVLIAGVLILNIIDDLIVNVLIGSNINSIPFGRMQFAIGNKALIHGGLYTDFLPYSLVLVGCFFIMILCFAFMKFREIEKGL